jgi:hypothetical protein
MYPMTIHCLVENSASMTKFLDYWTLDISQSYREEANGSVYSFAQCIARMLTTYFSDYYYQEDKHNYGAMPPLLKEDIQCTLLQYDSV